MTVASVFLNLAIICAYDWSKTDWLLLESLKQAKGSGEGTGGWTERILRKGDVAAFFLLSWIDDAITVTLYLRHGAHQFNGLTKRDWMIFGASTIVSNLFWIAGLASVIEILRWLW